MRNPSEKAARKGRRFARIRQDRRPEGGRPFAAPRKSENPCGAPAGTGGSLSSESRLRQGAKGRGDLGSSVRPGGNVVRLAGLAEAKGIRWGKRADRKRRMMGLGKTKNVAIVPEAAWRTQRSAYRWRQTLSAAFSLPRGGGDGRRNGEENGGGLGKTKNVPTIEMRYGTNRDSVPSAGGRPSLLPFFASLRRGADGKDRRADSKKSRLLVGGEPPRPSLSPSTLRRSRVERLGTERQGKR